MYVRRPQVAVRHCQPVKRVILVVVHLDLHYYAIMLCFVTLQVGNLQSG